MKYYKNQKKIDFNFNNKIYANQMNKVILILKMV